MPVGAPDSGIPGGQQITFAIESDVNAKYSGWRWIRAKKFKPQHGKKVFDTCQKIANRNGHPEMAETIAKANHIKPVPPKQKGKGRTIPSVQHPLQPGRLLRIPALLSHANNVDVFCDDPPPVIKDGYAVLDTVDIPGREGISRFKGYNPIVIDVPIQWDEWTARDAAEASFRVEEEIMQIERMAGRGQFKGSGSEPPPVIRVSVTDNDGNRIPLLPPNYQWSKQNPHAPLWRISNIAWDANPLRVGARRGRINEINPNDHPARGRRLRQKAVVTLTKYTGIHIVEKSATKRARKRESVSQTMVAAYRRRHPG